MRRISKHTRGAARKQYTMPFNTATVSTAIAPIVIQTFFNHVSIAALHYSTYLLNVFSTVPQSQTPRTKTNSPHLLRRRPTSNPQISPLRLPPHSRRHPTLHSTMGTLSNLGVGRSNPHSTILHLLRGDSYN